MSKLLSVIIPVYNTEKYLKATLDSALSNSYFNMEIIVINDGSPGNFEDTIYPYKHNPKIHIVYHPQNKGLFRARITGFQHAKGEYIAFLDSDDTVSIDWYRSLIAKIESEDADMAIGDFNLCYANKHTFFPRSIIRKSDLCLSGCEVQDTFFHQAGIDFSWHIGCNKVYTRQLLESAIKLLDPIDEHIVMCEDVLFSSTLYMLARKVVNNHHNYYYYNKNVQSSTSDIKNYKKYIDDIVRIFNHVRKIIISNEAMQKYISYINLWEDRILWQWKVALRKNNDATTYIVEKMHDKNFMPENHKENYYYYEETVPSYAFEDIKKLIATCDVVSFDVFDTLLMRPFLEPVDLFSILEDYANKLLDSVDSIHFKTIRIEAEKHARHLAWTFNNNNQEVSLDDIYETIGATTCLDKQFIEKIKAKEIELELHYLSRRNSGYELYSMAKHLGKKIIITSDMYLSKEIIKIALEKNGYTDFDNIFVSSELNLTKSTGDLFKHIRKIYANKRIVHGGDNYHSDVEVPRNLGLDVFHLPKAVDIFAGKYPQIYAGSFFSSLPQKTFGMIRTETAYDFLGFRCALALIANKLFDNPFTWSSPNSDFSGDTNQIGYSILGMYILASCIDLKDHIQKYDTILFYARDGYLVKRAFELFKQTFNLNIKTEYCYVSRKSLMPLFISKKEDLYSFVNFFEKHTSINDVLKVLSHISKFNFNQSLDVAKKFIDFDISDKVGWMKFLTFFAEELYSQEKVDNYKSSAKKYFDRICQKKCASIDVGYSFRADYLLNKVYNYNITPYVIHINNEHAIARTTKGNIKWHSILSYTPLVTGCLRETSVSEIGPSCIGYDEDGNPILEHFRADYPACLEINCLQHSAVQFIKDYLSFFDDDFNLMRVRYFDLCLPFEIFNIEAKITDRKWAECVDFEDDLHAGSKNTLFSLWLGQTLWAIDDYTQKPIIITRKEKLKRIFLRRDKYFIKYYLYKLLSKITSGRVRKKLLARRLHYKKMIFTRI